MKKYIKIFICFDGLKKISVLLPLIICFNNFSKAQSVSYISYEYTEVIQVSIEYSYSTSDYYSCYSPVGFYDYALSTLQARYDYYHAILSEEYHKLNDLKLINTQNQITIQKFRNERLSYIYNAITTWDLSNTTNSSNILNHCTEVYSYPTIKSEIKLLRECYYEIVRLKYEFPNSYHTTARYQSIKKMLEYLKNCPASQISSLHWLNFENVENIYSSKKPSLLNIMLIPTFPNENGVFKNGYFTMNEDTASFIFAMYNSSNNQYISSSYGTIGEVTELELESLDDGSISYDYSFDWNFNNSYNSDKGICKVNISIYPIDNTFYLKMKNNSSGQVWEYRGFYKIN